MFRSPGQSILFSVPEFFLLIYLFFIPAAASLPHPLLPVHHPHPHHNPFLFHLHPGKGTSPIRINKIFYFYLHYGLIAYIL